MPDEAEINFDIFSLEKTHVVNEKKKRKVLTRLNIPGKRTAKWLPWRSIKLVDLILTLIVAWPFSLVQNKCLKSLNTKT